MGTYKPGREQCERQKRYVEVVADTSPDGTVTPLTIVWDTGVRYHIDKVYERRQAHSLRTGGTGMRYTVSVGGHRTYLFFDDYRGAWFVEAKS
jgi:hypothetical protein